MRRAEMDPIGHDGLTAQLLPARGGPMARDDFDDLNVMSLTETKSQRAPTPESLRLSGALTPEPPRVKWLTAAAATVFISLIAFAIMHRMSMTISDAS